MPTVIAMLTIIGFLIIGDILRRKKPPHDKNRTNPTI